jgi:CBS domain-containing protein
MSPRAAWRLEQLGFDRSVDYVGGKMDWLSYDLPWEGSARLVGRELDRNVPTCVIGEKVSEVRARLSKPGLCIVLFDGRIVAGSLDGDALRAHDDELVEHVMSEGPKTVRPSEEVRPLAERMRDKGVDHIVVTLPNGRLVGVYRPKPGSP